MNFKKLFAVLLCMVAFTVMLASCKKDDETQYWLDKYKEMNKGQPQVIETVNVDLYIIKGDDMSADTNITKTVQDKINQYLYATYHTNINIKYISEAEYFNTVNGFTSETSGIVLVNSEETMDALKGKLVDLYPFIHGDEYKSQKYGQLNKQITTSLMNAAIVEEKGVEKLYCIPNDHVIGSYEYIVINKDLVGALGLPYSNSQYAEMTSLEDVEDLKNAAMALGASADAFITVDYEDYNPASGAIVTVIENAPYVAKSVIEAVNEDFVVNISKYPVADAAEVYSSAFAILEKAPAGVDSALYAERAMQVIYEINANEEIRNLLQYGVENVNYYRDQDGVVIPHEEKRYDMNLLYTGDVFKAYYTEGWSEFDKLCGEMQNKDTDK